MTRFVAKFPALPLLLAVGMGWATLAGTSTVEAQSATAPSTATPAKSKTNPAKTSGGTGGDKSNKKPKRDRSSNDAAAKPDAKGPKEIPFPLGIGMPASDIKIPETDPTGRLLSQLLAAKATRIDNEHVEMREMTMDLNHPDGREDYHVVMPTSVFNLQTRIITSRDPVVVRTQDFELTGEGMEFNTVERTGKLLGKVRMLIHNLKGLAGQAQPTPKPE